MNTSKSIHAFNNATTAAQNGDDSKSKQSGSSNESAPAKTKFLKQSPDNISQREVVTVTVPVVTAQTTKEMVSIGCQTISTGDITVTDVYIE